VLAAAKTEQRVTGESEHARGGGRIEDERWRREMAARIKLLKIVEPHGLGAPPG